MTDLTLTPEAKKFAGLLAIALVNSAKKRQTVKSKIATRKLIRRSNRKIVGAGLVPAQKKPVGAKHVSPTPMK